MASSFLIESPKWGSEVTYFDYEDITVSNTSIGFTAGTIAPTGEEPARVAIVSVEADQIRYTLDGTVPTSTKGHLMEKGDILTLSGVSALIAFRAIRVTTDATLRVTFGRLI